jgi:hypothetical protein
MQQDTLLERGASFVWIMDLNLKRKISVRLLS